MVFRPRCHRTAGLGDRRRDPAGVAARCCLYVEDHRDTVLPSTAGQRPARQRGTCVTADTDVDAGSGQYLFWLSPQNLLRLSVRREYIFSQINFLKLFLRVLILTKLLIILLKPVIV